MKIMINSFLIIFLTSVFVVSGQENIKFKCVDRLTEYHQKFLDLCNNKIKNKYKNLAKISSDSIKIYAEEFRKGTEIIIQTNEEEFVITVGKDYLIHQRYIDFILLKKEKLLSNSSFLIRIRFDSPLYPKFNLDYKIIVENLENKILNSKSLIIKFGEFENLEKRHVLLEFSPVDEINFEKIRKKCATPRSR